MALCCFSCWFNMLNISVLHLRKKTHHCQSNWWSVRSVFDKYSTFRSNSVNREVPVAAASPGSVHFKLSCGWKELFKFLHSLNNYKIVQKLLSVARGCWSLQHSQGTSVDESPDNRRALSNYWGIWYLAQGYLGVLAPLLHTVHLLHPGFEPRTICFSAF